MKRTYPLLLGSMALVTALVTALVVGSVAYFGTGPAEEAAPFRLEKPQAAATVGLGEDDTRTSRIAFDALRLRDPRTGRIPPDIRSRELAFAQQIPARVHRPGKNGHVPVWKARGPNNVGGRTRALAVDQTNPDRLLAGGVSGGLFLSENRGGSWSLVTDLSDLPSVTAIAQDPTNPAVWYYGTGEGIGNSASDPFAFYLGRGVFRSTDGGITWAQLPSTVGGLATRYDNLFDVVWNVAVHPADGSVLVAAAGAILRSTDGGASWALSLISDGGIGGAVATDVALAANGDVYATLAASGNGATQFGVYRSTDRGASWTRITPPQLSTNPYRMVLGPAPSQPQTVYVLAQTTPPGTTAGDHALLRYDAVQNRWTDLSAAIPDVPSDSNVDGEFNSQGGYDLLVKVKPDAADVLWIGGTNLFRSTDGGQSFVRVGGYDPATFLYPDHHPDQHALAFFPDDPDALVSGHDGGVSYTPDALETPQTWTSLNNGYLTTQFYAIAIDPFPISASILGGMQDNGTWRTRSRRATADWENVGGGDGGYAAVVPGGFESYLSVQGGRVFRNNEFFGFSEVTPADAANALFIAPYALDPLNPRVMYYGGALETVWINTDLDDIPQGNPGPTTVSWTALANAAVPSAIITAVGPTTDDALYFGAFGVGSAAGTTKLVRVDDPLNNGAGVDITPPLVPGSYINSIDTSPLDPDEVLVTVSNYGVPSVWHSTDGGASWTDVEGSLAGPDAPSVRWATILPGFVPGAATYFLGTSTGLYATTALDGSGTDWEQEGADVLGNVVVDMVAGRFFDGYVAVGTHGRGVYSARFDPWDGLRLDANVDRLALDVRAGEQVSETVELTNGGTAGLDVVVIPHKLTRVGEAGKHSEAVTLRPVVSQTRSALAEGEAASITVSVDATDLAPGRYQTHLAIASRGGSWSLPVELRVDEALAPSSTDVDVPTDLELAQNYPNPFNPTTTISYALPAAAHITLSVFDVTGRRVRVLTEGYQATGRHQATWNGTDASGQAVASGLYLYRLDVRDADGRQHHRSGSMTLLK